MTENNAPLGLFAFIRFDPNSKKYTGKIVQNSAINIQYELNGATHILSRILMFSSLELSKII